MKSFHLVASRTFCSHRKDCEKGSKIAAIFNVSPLTKAKDRGKNSRQEGESQDFESIAAMQ